MLSRFDENTSYADFIKMDFSREQPCPVAVISGHNQTLSRQKVISFIARFREVNETKYNR